VTEDDLHIQEDAAKKTVSAKLFGRMRGGNRAVVPQPDIVGITPACEEDVALLERLAGTWDDPARAGKTTSRSMLGLPDVG
jgi:hypothetical protein